jgi:hypothetical protein
MVGLLGWTWAPGGIQQPLPRRCAPEVDLIDSIAFVEQMTTRRWTFGAIPGC